MTKAGVMVVDDGSIHVAAFDELAQSICGALQDLGHECAVHRLAPGTALDETRRWVVIGACRAPWITLPADAVIYNTEQVGSPWFSSALIQLYNRYAVWEYSLANAALYPSVGLRAPAAIVPFGWHRSQHIIERRPMRLREIDIVHVGSICDRRLAALGQMEQMGLRVFKACGMYSRERDAVLARSKLLVNIHFYPTAIHESVRVVHAVANYLPVLSEPSAAGERQGGTLCVDLSEIPDAARVLVRDADFLEHMAETAARELRARPFAVQVSMASRRAWV